MMLEEIDYSEEAKYNLFESSEKNNDWITCIISGTKPDYELVKEKLKKINISITEKKFKEICKKLHLS